MQDLVPEPKRYKCCTGTLATPAKPKDVSSSDAFSIDANVKVTGTGAPAEGTQMRSIWVSG
ncbi:hypothetical protein GCM10025771_13840 [Niveibacterium umoris]